MKIIVNFFTQDGRVTFNEASDASLCNVLAAPLGTKCNWVAEVLHTDAHANVRTDYDGQEDFVRRELVKIVLNTFNKFDTSNDNYLFMDEFFLFGDALFTAELFFRRATR